MLAVYRASVFNGAKAAPWIDCEIIGRHWPSGAYVLREVGKLLPGVWLGAIDQVRIPAGMIEQPEIVSRNVLPANVNRWKYRTIREACGRDEALRAVLEP